MIISKHWLREFVFLPDALDAQDLARRLTLAVAEVEKVVELENNFAKMVVGKITKIAAHPNADKLKVCTVDVGETEVTIVCGGSNVIEGMKVIVGLVGAKVKWHGQGDLVELTLAKIRGVESSGMICAADEVGLADQFPQKTDAQAEIVDLSDNKARPGTSLAAALGLDDVIFEIDNKSLTNRPDLWGHYGMAREIAALTRKKFTPLVLEKIKTDKKYSLNVKVTAPDLCPRYQAVIIEGVSAIESPAWLKTNLIAAGQRPINAIVDLTNYILFELGQPLHAFDAAILNPTGQEISLEVRKALADEQFVTLDEKELILPETALVISNNGLSVALAGIKGGKNSEVTNTTSVIVLESANFKATSVRQTATSLNLRTEASTRFEKSLDPNLTEFALARFVELAKKVWPGSSVVSSVVDVRNFNDKPFVLEFPIKFISDRLGVEISNKTITDILERLGFEVQIKKGQLHLVVPTWRASKDVRIPEDVVEEVARLFGYENIPGSLPDLLIAPPVTNKLRLLEREIKEVLAFESGFTEVYNYSFVSPEWLDHLEVRAGKAYVELANPMAKDKPILRRELIPGLLENIKNNAHVDSLAFFECGRVFLPDEAGERATGSGGELLPAQPLKLGLVFSSKTNTEPFYELSEVISALSVRLGLVLELKTEEILTEQKLYHPGRNAVIICGTEIVGRVAELHPAKQAELSLPARVAVAELSVTNLLSQVRSSNPYQTVPEFPEVVRDFALVVGGDITHAQICDIVRSAHDFVRSVAVFDVYEAASLGKDLRSLAYHVTLGADHTLTTEEIDSVLTIIKNKLTTQVKAEWRS